jgi:hypothetical protein
LITIVKATALEVKKICAISQIKFQARRWVKAFTVLAARKSLATGDAEDTEETEDGLPFLAIFFLCVLCVLCGENEAV